MIVTNPKAAYTSIAHLTMRAGVVGRPKCGSEEPLQKQEESNE